MDLLNCIPVGAENAITTKELMQYSGITDKRILQAEIHNLREHGCIICSQTKPPAGYFIAANPQEAARFVQSMESRRQQIKRAIKAARIYCQGEISENAKNKGPVAATTDPGQNHG